MTPLPTRWSVVHLLVLLLITGCTTAAGGLGSRGASRAIDLSGFNRVWVAGFVVRAGPDIDVNGETVRLLRNELRSKTQVRVIEAPPLTVADGTLHDKQYWKQAAEEYSWPLIVTGSIALRARPNFAEIGGGGRSSYVPRKGYALDATLLFIDGRTGEVLASDRLPRQTIREADNRASTLSLYFQLMERVMPMFLRHW